MDRKIKKIKRKIDSLSSDQAELVKEYYKDKPWAVLGEQRSLFKNCTDFPLFAQPEEDKQTKLF